MRSSVSWMGRDGGDGRTMRRSLVWEVRVGFESSDILDI